MNKLEPVYGSGSIWSGLLATFLFTIFQTLLLNNVNPKRFLRAYLEACAVNGGRPPEDLEAFGSWNLTDQQKAAWGGPEPFT
jgi:hypothetical protein